MKNLINRRSVQVLIESRLNLDLDKGKALKVLETILHLLYCEKALSARNLIRNSTYDLTDSIYASGVYNHPLRSVRRFLRKISR